MDDLPAERLPRLLDALKDPRRFGSALPSSDPILNLTLTLILTPTLNLILTLTLTLTTGPDSDPDPDL